MGIAENLAQVKDSIAEAATQASRQPTDIDLVAVSKVHPAETVREALVAGQRVFGENRVQEAQGKWPALKEEFDGVQLHLIGSLQTNKVKDAVALFDVIETVDRPKLARAIAKEQEKQGKSLDVYLQINTGEEDQKGGCLPAEADGFIKLCRDELNLSIKGLMCIPPADEEPSLHFAFLRELAKRHGLNCLSMGMSGDYETAIRFGATSVRVGTAIFGTRPKKL
ncbi:YggS family pyridoxal phosphate-dependent enzyme [Terasakiella sp. A23]|uniref:YggS family pyridoxal phosphate-dependent enzyme n=1 Tax=Terasakiella sp. FCG-A23 TaxID=3080561 RepID=UPI002954A83E|nr:YggS family pyridoxal phosphate-dependent enzyme [Terasakiella sp. A23]MDV7339860.1 YggS family pyridoxal phosphate-dependent enzyme [Terasakiella sp. A23]